MKTMLDCGRRTGLKELNVKSASSNNNKAKQELKIMEGKYDKVNFKELR